MADHEERLQRLEPALREQVQGWRLAPVVQALQALRGVQFPGAVTLLADLGDLTRGARRRQGTMTTAGTTFARRALSEGAGA